MQQLKRSLNVAAAAIVAVAAAADAAADCTPVSGSIRLSPDDSCRIMQLYPGPAYLAQFGVPNSCFRVVVSGTINGLGYAGQTAEQAVSAIPNGGAALTPQFLTESGLGNSAPTRTLFTARSAIQTQTGRIYTADAGVVFNVSSTVQIAAEQLRIVGGNGAYSGASGVITVSGNEFTGAAYTGQICTPPIAD